MKKIALLGDSIRLGYEKYVKDSLEGVAEVYSPKDNCKYTFNLIHYFPSTKAAFISAISRVPLI